MRNRTYITTSIPYVNGRPHVGFALELVQADVLARYYRLIGNDTQFQTGTDENAFKNVQSAKALNIEPTSFVTQNAEAFRQLCSALDIRYDEFIRTTASRHHRGVTALWDAVKPDDIYVKEYSGLYCSGCEDFYQEKYLNNGVCPDHGIPPVPVNESNYFFRLSAYQPQIEALIESKRLKITPETRRREILRFVRNGLQDISISRLASRSDGWGVPVPGDDSQVVYVWIDALVNYISGLGYGTNDDWRHYWSRDTHKIHVIGKNVWKFHAIYWPALLLSAGLPLPDEILVHGFLTENGKKISKSNGPAVDPFVYIDDYGADAIRYYLLRAVSPCGDGDFSIARLKEIYNADLANGLGNLLSRLVSLASKGDYQHTVPNHALDAPSGYHKAICSYRFDDCLKLLWQSVTALNVDIDQTQPWKLLRSDNRTALHDLLPGWFQRLSSLAEWLSPLLPESAARIQTLLTQQSTEQSRALFPRKE